MKKFGWILSILIIFVFAGFYFLNKTDQTIGKEEPPNSQEDDQDKQQEGSNKPDEDENQNESDEPTLIEDAQALEIAVNIMKTIPETFAELGAEHKWTSLKFRLEEGYTLPDYEVAKPSLLSFSTENFADNTLKNILTDYYCECDADYLPSYVFNLKYEVVEKSKDSFTVKNFEPINLLDNGGYTMYYTIVQEDGTWKMDEWKKVMSDEEPVNISAEAFLDFYSKEYPEDAFGKLVFIETIQMDGSEVEKYNGGHPEPDGMVDVHVYLNEEYNSYMGVSAASTKMVTLEHIEKYTNGE